MPRAGLISLSNHPFTYWSDSLGSLADRFRRLGKKGFLAAERHPFLVLANRPSTSLDDEWVESETELSRTAHQGGGTSRGMSLPHAYSHVSPWWPRNPARSASACGLRNSIWHSTKWDILDLRGSCGWKIRARGRKVKGREYRCRSERE